jgi:serine/threonine protein kinase
MGEVYRARDPRLGREVAIKVLPGGLTDDQDRLKRFEREARAAAALNSPNILTVFDIGHDGPAPYIVSELLEGQSLARCLFTAQPLPVRKVIDYAVQIARGLAAAHERGIVHRDLKPANLFVTNDGRVKILDFGLAKLIEHEAAAAGASQMSTATFETTPGVVLGTIGYMSPEQVRGQTADYRSDIFSFGAILYEMLSGRRAFVADTAAETMTAILKEDPPDLQLQGVRAIPPAVARIVDRCLEKGPGARFQSTGDLAFSLEALSTSSGQSETLPASSVPRRSERTAWIVGGAAMLTAVGLAAALYIVSRPRETQPLHVSMTLPEGWNLALSSSVGEPTSLVVSPNGRRVAIVARRENGPTMILMRELDSRSARQLAGTEGATSLFWSPDSRFIGFFADGKIMKVDVSGGVPTSLCHASALFDGGTWSRDGTIVYSIFENGNFSLWRVAASGGQPSALRNTSAGQQANGWELRPWFLPDGRSFLYVVFRSGAKPAVYAGSLDSGERVKVVETDSANVQYANGYLLFGSGATLMAQPFDEKRHAVTGVPIPVVDNVRRQGVIGLPYRLFSASQTGVLAYQVATDDATLAWVDRRGQVLGTIGERAKYEGIALSHDETRVAAVVDDPSNLFIINLSNAVRTQFTFDPDPAAFPIWSPDDQFIDFDKNFVPIRRPSNGAGAIQRTLPDQKGPALPFDRGRDDSLLVMIPRGKTDLTVIPGSGDRTPFRLASTPDDKRLAKFSPDGRWVAYVSWDFSGQDVWVVPVIRRTGAGDVKFRISGADGGTLPQWSADGRQLFYISSSEMLTAVEVNGDGQAFQQLGSKALFPIRVSQIGGGYKGWHYAVSKDGRRFLIILGAEEPVSIEVNWIDALKR